MSSSASAFAMLCGLVVALAVLVQSAEIRRRRDVIVAFPDAQQQPAAPVVGADLIADEPGGGRCCFFKWVARDIMRPVGVTQWCRCACYVPARR